MNSGGNKAFDIDGPFMHVLETIFHLWVLNIITIICCIPIITAGAALTAMQHQLYLIAKKEDGYVVRGYFKDFASNFKRSTPAGLIMVAAGAALGIDAYIFMNKVGTTAYSAWYKCGIVALILLYLFVFVYLFPVLARYESSLGLAFKNALFMAVYKLPKSILMIVIFALPWVLTAFVANFWIWDILFGLSLPAFANVYLIKGTFEAFEKNQKEKSGENNESSEDIAKEAGEDTTEEE